MAAVLCTPCLSDAEPAPSDPCTLGRPQIPHSCWAAHCARCACCRRLLLVRRAAAATLGVSGHVPCAAAHKPDSGALHEPAAGVEAGGLGGAAERQRGAGALGWRVGLRESICATQHRSEGCAGHCAPNYRQTALPPCLPLPCLQPRALSCCGTSPPASAPTAGPWGTASRQGRCERRRPPAHKYLNGL